MRIREPSSAATDSPISTRDLLLDFGFAEDPSDSLGRLSFDFGLFKLWAYPCVNLSFAPIVLLTGDLQDSRTHRRVFDELPARVESFEQAAAWLAWCLDKALGTRFSLASEPAWLAVGRRHRHLLPWEREMAAYRARPHCYLQRDWARLVVKTLEQRLASVSEDTPVFFRFDGSVLTIRCVGHTIAVAAEGQPWQQVHRIKAGALKRLPKRFVNRNVEVSVWDSFLTIGRSRYGGAASDEMVDDA